MRGCGGSHSGRKYEGVEEAGAFFYEQSEVDHHRGSQAKAKEVMEGTITCEGAGW